MSESSLNILNLLPIYTVVSLLVLVTSTSWPSPTLLPFQAVDKMRKIKFCCIFPNNKSVSGLVQVGLVNRWYIKQEFS